MSRCMSVISPAAITRRSRHWNRSFQPNGSSCAFGGSPADRVDQLLDGSAPAATVFGAQYYVMEQLGFRKIVDASFMIAAMVPHAADVGDVRKYFAALRRAQTDIDIAHQPYTKVLCE